MTREIESPLGLTRTASVNPDKTSVGGAELHYLINNRVGSISMVVVRPGLVSHGGRLDGMEDMFFILSGTGELWRSAGRGSGAREEVVKLVAGVTVVIPSGVSYQYRGFGKVPLTFFEVVVPEWDQKRRLESEGMLWWPALPGGPDVPQLDPEHEQGLKAGAVPWDTTRFSDIKKIAASKRHGFDVVAVAPRFNGAVVEHLTLPPGSACTSQNTGASHLMWGVINGVGEIWRENQALENELRSLKPGVGIYIPPGTGFQVCASDYALELLSITVNAGDAANNWCPNEHWPTGRSS